MMRNLSSKKGSLLVISGLIALTVVGQFLLFEISISENHDFIHFALTTASQALLFCAACLSLYSFFAYRRANLRLQGLIEERDKTRQLTASLATHKAGIDAHTIVSRTDAQGIITYVNDKFCEVTQYSRAELIGKHHSFMNSGVQPSSYFEEMYQTIGRGETWSGDICDRTKDGSLFWVASTVMPVLDSEGNLTEILCLRTDISEKKRKEDDLQKSNQILHSTFENFPGAISAYDKDLVLQLANPAFYELLNISAEDFPVGSNFAQIYRHNAKTGVYGDGDVEEMVSGAVALAKKFEPHHFERTTPDGQVLEVKGWPLDRGGFVSSHIDVTAQREREAELLRTRDALEHIAYFDALTALPNRAHCQQDLEALFGKEGSAERFSIIQIDLDKFKRVNDTMGHAAGDHLLKNLGSRLSFLASSISGFKPYRWGGDEFIAIVTGKSADNLDAVCQELTDLTAIPVDYQSSTLWPTVSLGVATCPDDASELEALMICADLALYKTKKMGRDGYQFFSAEMKEKIDSDIEIETDVRSALELNQFELYFQPQISTVDESITGIEALVRWNHPTKGMLPPGHFMDVVENHGMASALGRVIFDKAMSSVRYWMDEGLDFGRLAINLSAAHLKRNSLTDELFESIAKHNVDPDLLAVELLESVLVDREESNTRDLLEKLNSSGVHVELDDFGTGYASLSHLSNLPVDGIKIDRSFVTDIATCEKQQAIVEVVMSMSRLMQLRVVCEGIETHQELSAVSKISNCSVQGYLVARPLSMRDITTWIREKRNIGLLTAPTQLQSSSCQSETQ